MIAELLNSTVPPAPARAGGGGPLRRPSGGGRTPLYGLLKSRESPSGFGLGVRLAFILLHSRQFGFSFVKPHAPSSLSPRRCRRRAPSTKRHDDESVEPSPG